MFKNVHPLDLASILSLIVGLSSIVADSVFQSSLTAIFGSYSPKIVAFLGMAGMVSSQVLRVIGAPSGTVLSPQVVVPSPSDSSPPKATAPSLNIISTVSGPSHPLGIENKP